MTLLLKDRITQALARAANERAAIEKAYGSPTISRLQREKLESQLRKQGMAGDTTAFLQLHKLRQLWRSIDAMKASRNTTAKENHT